MVPVMRAAAVARAAEPPVSEGRVAAMLCSASPVANSRWMTWSCRSAAIRSRSSSIAQRCCSVRASASSIATEAWLANPAAMSSSSAVNAARPVSRATVSTPMTFWAPVSGTTSTGPTSTVPEAIESRPVCSRGWDTRNGLSGGVDPPGQRSHEGHGQAGQVLAADADRDLHTQTRVAPVRAVRRRGGRR